MAPDSSPGLHGAVLHYWTPSLFSLSLSPIYFPPPSLLPQNSLTEESVYQHMALASTAFAFSWSKWNNETSRGKFVVRAAESTSKQNSEQVRGSPAFFWSLFQQSSYLL